MMKRIGAVLLAAALILSLAGCASKEERQSRKNALLILRGDDLGYTLSTGTRADNEPVYDDGTIQIRLGGIEGTTTEPQIVLAIKNGRRKSISFVPQRCIINGWQTDCWADVYEIDGHSTITATVSISSGLDLVQPSDIDSIQLDYDLYDSDSYNLITSASYDLPLTVASEVEDYTPSGVTLCTGNYRVKVGLTHNTYDGSANLCTYIENNTDRTINVTTSKVKLNGESVEYLFYQDVVGHARRLSSDAIYELDSYDTIELTEGDTLTYSLIISDGDSGVQLMTRDVSLSYDDLTA